MPVLTILAGPNGVGKSRLTDYLFQKSILPYPPIDLDLLQATTLNNIPTSIYSVNIDKDLNKLFKSYCLDAINDKRDFSYECNLRKDQLKYIGMFEEADYKLRLVYLTLSSTEQSRKRVQYRVSNEGGRFVNNENIKCNFEEGLQNLDAIYNEFNQVIVLDNSLDFKDPQSYLFYKNEKCPIFINKQFPNELIKQFLPNINKLKSEIHRSNPNRNIGMSM
jgi:predicted ABC-type ATPase